jgi:hypothetical protein
MHSLSQILALGTAPREENTLERQFGNGSPDGQVEFTDGRGVGGRRRSNATRVKERAMIFRSPDRKID